MLSTAMALATLPPLAPPMPSHTTAQALSLLNSPPSQASWLEERTAPTSVSKSTFIAIPSFFVLPPQLPAGGLDIRSQGPPHRGGDPLGL